MPEANPQALEFLLNRRSRPAKTLTAPWPDRAALAPILTAAARSPDHGKLEPWRFIVLTKGALTRLAHLAQTRGDALDLEPEKTQKMADQFARAGCVVAVIEVQRSSEKIPVLEQTYAVGGVCLALLNAGLAAGWGANWLSGWGAHDRAFMEHGLGLQAHERVAGFLHLGTETNAPPERPRPDLDAITSWVET